MECVWIATHPSDIMSLDMLREIHTATKRAEHFCKLLKWEGLFSPISTTGLSIPIRNGLWFIDLKENESEDDFAAELLALGWMAKAINKWIDSHLVEGDEETQWAMAAFLVRAKCWGNLSGIISAADKEKAIAKPEDTRGITMAAGKFVYKQLVERYKKGEDTSNISPQDLVEEQDLWLVDEWTHVGFCIMTCLDNPKLIESYNKGNHKVMDALLGKTIKLANMTVDAELVKELLPMIIAAHFTK
jgi:Asp-tRNA(Asn)/Glu-tRNA(Gln) amidotransferase B subunit